MRANSPHAPTREHIVPRHLGQGRGPVIIVCKACNNDKGALALDVWLRLLEVYHDRRAVHVTRWIDRNPTLVAEARRLEAKFMAELVTCE